MLARVYRYLLATDRHLFDVAPSKERDNVPRPCDLRRMPPVDNVGTSLFALFRCPAVVGVDDLLQHVLDILGQIRPQMSAFSGGGVTPIGVGVALGVIDALAVAVGVEVGVCVSVAVCVAVAVGVGVRCGWA